MLTDFGFTQVDPGMKQIIQKVTAHLADGMYATRQTLPQKNAGSLVPDPTADEWHALPCDTLLITYALLQMGINDERIQMSGITRFIWRKF